MDNAFGVKLRWSTVQCNTHYSSRTVYQNSLLQLFFSIILKDTMLLGYCGYQNCIKKDQ